MKDFEQEIIHLIPHIRRYAFALVNRSDVADDLVQDCLERALSRKHLWDKSRPMRPWLFTLLHNLYANEVRRYRRTPTMMVASNKIDEVIPAVGENDLLLQDLKQSLEQVSEEHRQVLLLVGMEQMTYKETAEILAIPIGTVMSRLTRARKNLKQVMDGQPSTRIRRIK